MELWLGKTGEQNRIGKKFDLERNLDKLYEKITRKK